ncbi:uncharacterized protein CLUP02_12392 [Colletotrichum lupini]|uniref:Uncharacterized protein n=1 Tax=Colletotrichum lupini TaxID=145971 RepID=A0A9Q8T166_9PEZI|nr:uncharacterized protein CLUP02_12392 [Colletotrichum lupini]UQC86890.1 hypothetical protein CLUP02_12392 [Colletotrichum lupini]
MEGFPFAAPVLGQVHIAFVSEYSSTGASTVILIPLRYSLSDKERVDSLSRDMHREPRVRHSALLAATVASSAWNAFVWLDLLDSASHPPTLQFSSQRRHQLRLQRTDSPPNSNHEYPTQTQTLRPLVVDEGHVCLFARLSELLILESSDYHARELSPDKSRSPYVRTERVTILTPC